MEAALGGELYFLVKLGPLPEKMVRMYFKQLIAGINYIHEEGVYHRDIKLENILFSEDLNLKISDFGLSIHKNEMKG